MRGTPVLGMDGPDPFVPFCTATSEPIQPALRREETLVRTPYDFQRTSNMSTGPNARKVSHPNKGGAVRKMAVREAYMRLKGVRPFDARSYRRPSATPLLTLDAFDTLVTRSVFRPTDAFTLCGIILHERALIAVAPSVWRDQRHHAEGRIAAAAHPHEVQLHEIYDRLVEMRVLHLQHRDAALEIELQVERTLSRPIAATIDWVNGFMADGGTAMVLSDTPLPNEAVTALLGQAGLALPGVAVHTSSQSGNTKRSGGHVPCAGVADLWPARAGAARRR